MKYNCRTRFPTLFSVKAKYSVYRRNISLQRSLIRIKNPFNSYLKFRINCVLFRCVLITVLDFVTLKIILGVAGEIMGSLNSY